MRRLNAIKLIKAGVTVTLGTDNYAGAAPEFRRTPKPESQEPGIGTIIAIEGLVELGMTPAQAIVSATKNGAIACKALNEFGTIEKGKIADLLVLDADPLADIKNIRKLKTIMRDGRIVDGGGAADEPAVLQRTDRAEAEGAGHHDRRRRWRERALGASLAA